MPAALTSLEAAREPAAVPAIVPAAVPVRVRTAPVAVAGLATSLGRRAEGADSPGGTTVAPQVGDVLRRRRRGAVPLAPLRRQATRVGTVRRMLAATDLTSPEPTQLRQGLNFSVALNAGERSRRDTDVKNAAEHAEFDAVEAQLSREEIVERIKTAEALAKASHAKSPVPFEAHRTQHIKEAWLAGAKGAITSHWELLLGYGDNALQWVKIDLTSVDGYRVIWGAEPRSLLSQLKVTGTVGEVLDKARTVAEQHTTYFNPDRPDADLRFPRYSCQHFVTEIAALYGETLHPVVKQ